MGCYAFTCRLKDQYDLENLHLAEHAMPDILEVFDWNSNEWINVDPMLTVTHAFKYRNSIYAGFVMHASWSTCMMANHLLKKFLKIKHIKSFDNDNWFLKEVEFNQYVIPDAQYLTAEEAYQKLRSKK